MMSNKLLWVDLETNQSELNSDSVIFEIGAIVTEYTAELGTIAVFSGTQYRRSAWQLVKDRIVVEMHVKSGLFEEMERTPDEPMPLLTRFGKFILEHFPDDERITLAGSGVAAFDKPWLEWFLSEQITKRFTYYSLDIGHVRRFMRLTGFRTPIPGFCAVSHDDKRHRGSADIRDHLSEARAFLAYEKLSGE